MVRNIKICIEQFNLFYDLLMQNTPEGYTPWFFKCERQGKNPFPGASWKDKSSLLNKRQALIMIKLGYNIGISARNNDPLIIIDIDSRKYINQMPENSLINTSRKRDGVHGFFWQGDDKVKTNIPTNDGEMRCCDQYVIAPGSYVPVDEKTLSSLSDEAKNDPLLGYYTIKNAVPPRKIVFDELPQFFKDEYNRNKEFENKPQTVYTAPFNHEKKGVHSDLYNMKMSDILGKIPAGKRFGHPLHDSTTDANFSMSEDGALVFCWRHMVSLNARQFLAVKSGYTTCQDAGTPFKRGRRNG